MDAVGTEPTSKSQRKSIQFQDIFKSCSLSLEGTNLLHSSKGIQMSKIFRFLKDETGATAIEYGLIAAGISVVIIATVNAIGSTLNAKFDYISQQLK